MPSELRLEPAGRAWGVTGCGFLVSGALTVPLAITLADDDAALTPGKIALASAIFAVACLGLDLRSRLPLRRDLPRPPADFVVDEVVVHPRWLLVIPYVAVWVVVAEALARLFDISHALVPGLLLGTGIARLLGAMTVGVWQARHHRRVLFGYDDGADEHLVFAADSPRGP